MTDADIPDPVLRWAQRAVDADGPITQVSRLRADGGPWKLQADGVEAVLKCGPAADWRELYACEASALRLAAANGIAAPQLLAFASEVDGTGRSALLMSLIPGTTRIPSLASAERLHALGQLAATIHRVPLEPSGALPLRTRHTAWTDFALWRRWGGRYRAARSDGERDGVLRDFLADHPSGGAGAMTGGGPWSIDDARETLSTTGSTPLLDAAAERIARAPVSDGPAVLVHGDLWQGNTMWDGDTLVGVIDWEVAGAGRPGVDVGCLRWDAVMLFGADAADQVLAGWEDAMGLTASDVAYWDLVAVLNYPTDMGRLVSTLAGQGRPDLDAPLLTQRRDAFLEATLDRVP